VTADLEHQDGDRRNGALKLERLELERTRSSRVSARERLEQALGPDLTELLLSALMHEGEGAADSDSLREHPAA
jgi:hypothetical protein